MGRCTGEGSRARCRATDGLKQQMVAFRCKPKEKGGKSIRPLCQLLWLKGAVALWCKSGSKADDEHELAVTFCFSIACLYCV